MANGKMLEFVAKILNKIKEQEVFGQINDHLVILNN
jgi:hypothetical protein